MMPCPECKGTKRHEKGCSERWSRKPGPHKYTRPYGILDAFKAWVLSTGCQGG